MKGFIVYLSSEVKDNKQYVYLFGRLENSETFLAINHFRPYFYIKTADRKKAEKIEQVDGKDVDKELISPNLEYGFVMSPRIKPKKFEGIIFSKFSISCFFIFNSSINLLGGAH